MMPRILTPKSPDHADGGLDLCPTFQHTGLEFLHMLKGQVLYQHGDRHLHMRPDDSLFFDADAPHGPVELIVLPACYLSIIAYPQAGGAG